MSGKTITATAVISAADKTGNVFDRLAQKIKGVEKQAKALGDIKAPKFVGNLEQELKRLKLTDKELDDVRRRRQAFMDELRAARPKADLFFRANSDWMNREVQHWRKIKTGIDEAASAHKRWRATLISAATGVAARGAALAGGVYGAYRVGRAGIKSAAENQREGARDYLAGLSTEESKRLEREALAASSRYQSVDSQTMHERLRDTAMSMRSVDNATALADTIAQGTTVLQSLKGKDKAIEEGRKFFSALDVMGKNMDPKEVRELFHGYIKALGVEGADMDLAGVLQFARQSRAAGGILSNRFLMTTMPGLARDLGDAQLGTALASSLSQNIGGRATEASKEAQTKFGLRDKDGKFLDAEMAMRDPDKYAWEKLMPALTKQGIDTKDDVKVVGALAKLFSNRTVQDVFAKLINQQAQYQGKAEQYAKAPGLEAAGELMKRDPFVAYEAVFAQLRTLAGQAPMMDSAAQGLTALSGAISDLNGAVQKNGDWIREMTKGAGDKVSKWWESETRDARAIGGVIKSVLDFDKKWGINPSLLGLGPKKDNPYPAAEDPMGADYSRKAFHSKAYWEGLGREGASAASAARLRREAELESKPSSSQSLAAPEISATMTHGTGVSSQPIQATLTGSAEVQGEAALSIKIEAPELIKAYYEAQKAISLAGQLRATNGPGSTGRSSPDAQAPGGTGYNGVY